MKRNDLIEKLNLGLLTPQEDPNREVSGVYIGDLLSRVMSHAGENDVWITIMQNINVAAVALLCDVSAVILCEGVRPDEDLLERAKKENICLLSSPLSAYELAVSISKLL